MTEQKAFYQELNQCLRELGTLIRPGQLLWAKKEPAPPTEIEEYQHGLRDFFRVSDVKIIDRSPDPTFSIVSPKQQAL